MVDAGVFILLMCMGFFYAACAIRALSMPEPRYQLQPAK
jgi:hypothetical protein